MLDKCMMKRVVDALPWPEGKKPVLGAGQCDAHGFVVNLHEPIDRGWTDIAKITGPTPERCLAFALEKWIELKGLTGTPGFVGITRGLTN